MIAGGFNAVANSEDVSDPQKIDHRRCSGQNDWIFEHGLIDLGFIGTKFTWARSSSITSFKSARLDRALSSVD